MDLNASWTPLQNSAELRRKCHPRLSHDCIADELRAYFSARHADIARPTVHFASHKIGDVLTLTVTAAEVFAADPNRWLLDHGIVVFPDLVCLELPKLSDLVALSPSNCEKLLEGNQFTVLDDFPDPCRVQLRQLGFVDSAAFQLFMIPPADAFAFAIRAHRAIVQPFPAELVEAMIGARRAATDRAKAAISEYVAAAETRFQEGGGPPKRGRPRK
jgi:hypothetical protein